MKIRKSHVAALPIIISIAALYFAWSANRLSEAQLKFTNWDYKIISDENYEVRELQFFSLNPIIKLQDFEIITEGKNNSDESFTSENETLNLYYLEKKLLERYFMLYDYSNRQRGFNLTANTFSDDYPVAVRFNYIRDNQLFSKYILYKVHFEIYEKSILRIRSISLIREIKFQDLSKLTAILSYIDKTECMANLEFSYSNKLFTEIAIFDSAAYYLALLTVFAESKVLQPIIFQDSLNNITNEFDATIPAILLDSCSFDQFVQKKDSLIKVSPYQEKLNTITGPIDSFLTQNPYTFTNYKWQSTWIKETTYSDWLELLMNQRIKIWQCYYP